MHLIKVPSGDIVAAINGSSAFGEVARAVIAFAKDPESEDVRVLSQEKNNAGRSDLALAYRIESAIVTTDDGKQTPVGSSASWDRPGGASAICYALTQQIAVLASAVAKCSKRSARPVSHVIR